MEQNNPAAHEGYGQYFTQDFQSLHGPNSVPVGSTICPPSHTALNNAIGLGGLSPFLRLTDLQNAVGAR